MNFHHLRAFYEVSRAGSISGGAERMHVSQPGVTREIKELEEQLGFMVFDRLPRGVSLTQAGTLLFDYAGRIFALSEAVEQELKQIAGFSKGHLKIGASATVGVYLAPDIIAEFNARYPKVSVELTVTNTEKVEKGLQNHEFALGLIEGPYDDTTLHTRCIGVDEIVAVAATGHPQAGRTLSARELEVLDLVAQALSNGQIASRLHLTEATVKRHLRNIFVKLGAVSRLDAVNKAKEWQRPPPATVPRQRAAGEQPLKG